MWLASWRVKWPRQSEFLKGTRGLLTLTIREGGMCHRKPLSARRAEARLEALVQGDGWKWIHPMWSQIYTVGRTHARCELKEPPLWSLFTPGSPQLREGSPHEASRKRRILSPTCKRMLSCRVSGWLSVAVTQASWYGQEPWDMSWGPAWPENSLEHEVKKQPGSICELRHSTPQELPKTADRVETRD